jgi:hypothetical protein
MLEVLLLVSLVRSNAKVAKGKGQSGWWGGLVALFWVAGEVAGFIVAGMMGSAGLAAYLFALMGAAVGAVAAWFVIYMLPHRAEEELFTDMARDAENPHYDPQNPFSPPKHD